MFKKFIRTFLLLTFFYFVSPANLFAHQPRIVESDTVTIKNPEISQAFYGELQGAPKIFTISSDEDFRLYVGILVPDLPGINKDISVRIFQNIDGSESELALLDGTTFEWTPFFEEFAGDNYFWGPEYAANNSNREAGLKGVNVPAGEYKMVVFSPSNLGKFSLVVGDIEAFPADEALNSLLIVPQVKSKFFSEPWYQVVFTLFGGAIVWLSFIMGMIFGFLWRLLVKTSNKKGKRILPTNIGSSDRFIRLALGVLLFIWATSTSWSPGLFFASGFCIFEGLFSWCGLYQLMGKNTCPV